MVSKIVEEIINDESKLEITPLIDVAFLILIFFMCLPFKTLDGKLQAFLPTDKGINPIEQDPVNEIMVSVHIVARAEVLLRGDAKDSKGRSIGYGPTDYKQDINKPTEFKFKFGDRETKDLAKVKAWIDEAFKTAKDSGETTKVKGEIKAGHKVPHKFVVALLNKFAEAGLDKVDFFGTQIPTAKLRRKPYLPYPQTNYGRTE